MSTSFNRRIVAELDALQAGGILTAQQADRIAARYPTEPWDVLVLVRWFTILGAVSAGVGVVLLAREYVSFLRLGEVALVGATVGLILLARWLKQARGLEKTSAALELAAGFALQGLTTLVAIDHSTGSKNWPALVGVQAVLLTGMAYWLQNRLILIHASVCLFIFFGGETDYLSGRGEYWMNVVYAVVFVGAGLLFLALAWLHATRFQGVYQSFSRVYAHMGLLVIHLALWFLSVFGYFGRWEANAAARLAFSVLWAAVSVASLWLGTTMGQRILRAYGLTFLIVNAYTFYFQFVVAHSMSGWFIHLLLVGGSLVWLGFWLERRLRPIPTDGPSATPAAATGLKH
jgi:hypothetical protein